MRFPRRTSLRRRDHLSTLLVCAAYAPEPRRWLPELAGDADRVVAVDGGADAVLAAGITTQLVVGDLDSARADTVDRLQRDGAEVMRFPADKDRSDLDLALEVVDDRWGAPVTVTGAFRGRLDHTLGALGSLARARGLAITLSEPDMQGWILGAPGPLDVRVAGHGRTLSVIPLLGDACVSIEGVKWPLDQATLSPLSDSGLSNLVQREAAHVYVHGGVVAVLVTSGQ